MSKPQQRPKGRPATDERGNATWKWEGSETRVETALVSALGEGLSLEPPPQNVNLDPYSQSTSPGKEKIKGRSLDDMRRLNEEMKREHDALVKSLRKRTFKKKGEPARGVRLQVADREFLVDERHSSVTIGRGEDQDIVVMGERVSLTHARIEISGNKLVLIDQSTNGSYVQTADGEESFVRRDRSHLKGRGMIGLGSRPKHGSPHTIRFTCEDV